MSRPRREPELDVAETVGEGEGELLRGRGAGLADVVAARPRAACTPGSRAAQYSIRSPISRRCGSGPKSHSFWAMYSLKMSVCSVPLSRPVSTPARSAATSIMQKTGHGGAADRHRGGHLREVDALEEHLHVGGGVDRHAAVADLAEAARVVGVAAHQRGHVEGDREAAAARGRGSSGSARWSAGRCRSRRTAGSSRRGRGSPWGRGRGCRGTPPGHSLSSAAVRRLDLHARERGEVGVADGALRPRLVVPLLPPFACAHAPDTRTSNYILLAGQGSTRERWSTPGPPYG